MRRKEGKIAVIVASGEDRSCGNRERWRGVGNFGKIRLILFTRGMKKIKKRHEKIFQGV
jgi:hypothetical protein